MAKQEHAITLFHGGLNNEASIRDVLDNEFPTLTNCNVDHIGRIEVAGSVKSVTFTIDDVDDITAGYGLFVFGMDYDTSNSQGSYQYIAIAGTATSSGSGYSSGDYICKIYEEDNTAYSDVIVINDVSDTGDTGEFRPEFYIAGGALRIHDSNLDNTGSVNKWFGAVPPQMFTDTNKPYDISNIVEDNDAAISPPDDLSMVFKGSPLSGSASSYTTEYNSTTGNFDLDTNDYDSYNDAVTANDFDASYGSAAVGFSIITKIKVRVVLSSPGTFDGCGVVVRIGHTDGSNAFLSTGYQYKETVLSLANTTDVVEIEIPDTLDISATNLRVSVRSTEEQGDTPLDTYVDYVTLYGGIDNGDIEETNDGNNVVYITMGDSVETAADWVDSWNVGISFIYDKRQESLVHQLYTGYTASGDAGLTQLTFSKAPYTNVELNYYYSASSKWNHRISGIKIYLKKSDGSTDWALHAEIDLIAGRIRRSNTKWFDGTVATGTGYVKFYAHLDGADSIDVPSEPYYIDDDIRNVPTFNANFKTGVYTNNSVYIGNVLYDGEYYPDSIFKSDVGQYDRFYLTRRIDTAGNDGEQIVKLVEYADRLLEFKEKTLYIVNISHQIEFLESVERFKGVTKPYHVFNTEYGPVWINKYGCYLYNGKQVIDLFLRDNIRKISSSYWQSFFSDNSSIAYYPDRRKILIVKNITSSDSDVLIFSFDVFSWVFGDSAFVGANDMSNFQIDPSKYIIFLTDSGSPVTMSRWDDDNPSGNTKSIEIVTKDITFGTFGRKANIYKVIFTYHPGQASSTSLNVYYAVDGNSSITTSLGTLTSPSANLRTVELEPSSVITDVDSFRLKISGTANVAFYLDNITIVYRLKGQH